jgi:hypothetical protein
VEAIRSGMTSLAEILNRVSTAAYQASAAEAGSTNGSGDGTGDGAGPSAGDGEGAGEGATADADGEEAVEGEFKEV